MNRDRCEEVRLELMAAFDQEAVDRRSAAPAAAAQHAESCADCREWLEQMRVIARQFERAGYPDGGVDLWPMLATRLNPGSGRASAIRRVGVIGAVALGWRAAQLLVDLPYPGLHWIVPAIAVIAALWQLTRDPLAIETFAPELQKRGA